ncbi:hypothetical protein HanRHA438_Chr02g0080211 [Helianthus annuus]|nr:hypothetical protein HanRHA438_Chr02g0080211 [Helianthus annuus]
MIKPTIAQEEVMQEVQEPITQLDLIKTSVEEPTARTEPKISSGIRYDVDASSSGGVPDFEEMLFHKTGKMKLVDDSESEEEVDVLENKLGREFADTNDDPMNVERRGKTAKEKVVEDAEHEAALNKYLETAQEKKRKLTPKKESNKQMMIMKNQDLNPLDENF